MADTSYDPFASDPSLTDIIDPASTDTSVEDPYASDPSVVPVNTSTPSLPGLPPQIPIPQTSVPSAPTGDPQYDAFKNYLNSLSPSSPTQSPPALPVGPNAGGRPDWLGGAENFVGGLVQPLGINQQQVNAFGDNVMQNIPQAAGGLAGAVAAGELVGPAAAALAVGGGPVGIIAGAVLEGGALLVGGLAGSALAGGATDLAEQGLMGKDQYQAWQTQLAQDRQNEPLAAAIGDFTANGLFLRPSARVLGDAAELAGTILSTRNVRLLVDGLAADAAPLIKRQANALMNVAFGIGSTVSQEAYNEIQSGNFQPAMLAASLVAGSLMNHPTTMGHALMQTGHLTASTVAEVTGVKKFAIDRLQIGLRNGETNVNTSEAGPAGETKQPSETSAASEGSQAGEVGNQAFQGDRIFPEVGVAQAEQQRQQENVKAGEQVQSNNQVVPGQEVNAQEGRTEPSAAAVHPEAAATAERNPAAPLDESAAAAAARLAGDATGGNAEATNANAAGNAGYAPAAGTSGTTAPADATANVTSEPTATGNGAPSERGTPNVEPQGQTGPTGGTDTTGAPTADVSTFKMGDDVVFPGEKVGKQDAEIKGRVVGTSKDGNSAMVQLDDGTQHMLNNRYDVRSFAAMLRERAPYVALGIKTDAEWRDAIQNAPPTEKPLYRSFSPDHAGFDAQQFLEHYTVGSDHLFPPESWTDKQYQAVRFGTFWQTPGTRGSVLFEMEPGARAESTEKHTTNNPGMRDELWNRIGEYVTGGYFKVVKVDVEPKYLPRSAEEAGRWPQDILDQGKIVATVTLRQEAPPGRDDAAYIKLLRDVEGYGYNKGQLHLSNDEVQLNRERLKNLAEQVQAKVRDDVLPVDQISAYITKVRAELGIPAEYAADEDFYNTPRPEQKLADYVRQFAATAQGMPSIRLDETPQYLKARDEMQQRTGISITPSEWQSKYGFKVVGDYGDKEAQVGILLHELHASQLNWPGLIDTVVLHPGELKISGPNGEGRAWAIYNTERPNEITLALDFANDPGVRRANTVFAERRTVDLRRLVDTPQFRDEFEREMGVGAAQRALDTAIQAEDQWRTQTGAQLLAGAAKHEVVHGIQARMWDYKVGEPVLDRILKTINGVPERILEVLGGSWRSPLRTEVEYLRLFRDTLAEAEAEIGTKHDSWKEMGREWQFVFHVLQWDESHIRGFLQSYVGLVEQIDYSVGAVRGYLPDPYSSAGRNAREFTQNDRQAATQVDQAVEAWFREEEARVRPKQFDGTGTQPVPSLYRTNNTAPASAPAFANATAFGRLNPEAADQNRVTSDPAYTRSVRSIVGSLTRKTDLTPDQRAVQLAKKLQIADPGQHLSLGGDGQLPLEEQVKYNSLPDSAKVILEGAFGERVAEAKADAPPAQSPTGLHPDDIATPVSRSTKSVKKAPEPSQGATEAPPKLSPEQQRTVDTTQAAEMPKQSEPGVDVFTPIPEHPGVLTEQELDPIIAQADMDILNRWNEDMGLHDGTINPSENLLYGTEQDVPLTQQELGESVQQVVDNAPPPAGGPAPAPAEGGGAKPPTTPPTAGGGKGDKNPRPRPPTGHFSPNWKGAYTQATAIPELADAAGHIQGALEALAQHNSSVSLWQHPITWFHQFYNNIKGIQRRFDFVEKSVNQSINTIAAKYGLDVKKLNDQVLAAIDDAGNIRKNASELNRQAPEAAALARLLHEYWTSTGNIINDPTRLITRMAIEHYVPHIIERVPESWGYRGKVYSGPGTVSPGTTHAIARANKVWDVVNKKWSPTEDGLPVYRTIKDLQDAGFTVKTNLGEIVKLHGQSIARASRMREFLYFMQRLDFNGSYRGNGKEIPFHAAPVMTEANFNYLRNRDPESAAQMRRVNLGGTKDTFDGYFVHKDLAERVERLSRPDEGAGPLATIAAKVKWINDYIYKPFKFMINPLHLYNMASNMITMTQGPLGILNPASPYKLWHDIIGRGKAIDADADLSARAMQAGLTSPKDLTAAADLGGLSGVFQRIPGMKQFHDFMWDTVARQGSYGVWDHLVNKYSEDFIRKNGFEPTGQDLARIDRDAARIANNAVGLSHPLDQTKNYRLYGGAMWLANNWTTAQMRTLGKAVGIKYLGNIGGGEHFEREMSKREQQAAQRLLFGGILRLAAGAFVLSTAMSYIMTGQSNTPFQNFQRDPGHTFDAYKGIDPVTHRDTWVHFPFFGFQRELVDYTLTGVKAYQEGKNPFIATAARISGKVNPITKIGLEEIMGREIGRWMQGFGDQADIDNDKTIVNIRKSLDNMGIPDFGSTENRIIYAMRQSGWNFGGFSPTLNTPTASPAQLAGQLVQFNPLEAAAGTRIDQGTQYLQQQDGSWTPASQIFAARDAKNAAIDQLVAAAKAGNYTLVNQIAQQQGLTAAQVTQDILYGASTSRTGGGVIDQNLPHGNSTASPNVLNGQQLSPKQSSDYNNAKLLMRERVIQWMNTQNEFKGANASQRAALMNAYIAIADKVTAEQYARTYQFKPGNPINDAQTMMLVQSSYNADNAITKSIKGSQYYAAASPEGQVALLKEYSTAAHNAVWDRYMGTKYTNLSDAGIQQMLVQRLNIVEPTRQFVTQMPDYQAANPYEQQKLMSKYTAFAQKLIETAASGKTNTELGRSLDINEVLPLVENSIALEVGALDMLHQSSIYTGATTAEQTKLDTQYADMAHKIAIMDTRTNVSVNIGDMPALYKQGYAQALRGRLMADEGFQGLQNAFGGADQITAWANELSTIKRQFHEQNNITPAQATKYDTSITAWYKAQHPQYAQYLTARANWEKHDPVGQLYSALQKNEIAFAVNSPLSGFAPGLGTSNDISNQMQ